MTACLNCGTPIDRSGQRRLRVYCSSTCGSEYRRRQAQQQRDARPLAPRACRCEGETPTTADEDGDRRCVLCGHWTPETLALAEGVFV